MAAWLGADAAQRRLWNAIATVVDVPPTGAIAIEVAEGDRDRAHRISGALRRRHDDLVAGRSTSEAHANAKLAGGYILPDAAAPKEPQP